MENPYRRPQPTVEGMIAIFTKPGNILSPNEREGDSRKQKNQRDGAADFGEELAVPNVKGKLAAGRNLERSSQHAFGKLAPLGIQQPLSDMAETIDKASHTGVGGPGHRATGLNTTKNSVRQVLLRAGRVEKPAIVSHVGEQVGAAPDKLPGQLAERVFKADERGDHHMIGR